MPEFNDNKIFESKINFDDLVKKKKEIFEQGMADDHIEEIQEKIVEFARNLKDEYPEEYQNSRLYHLIAGSTPLGEKSEKDFPGQFSIVDFIHKLYDEYAPKDQKE